MVFFICLIQKDQPSTWGVSWNFFSIFEGFFHNYHILICVNPSKIFILEIDVFDFGLNIVLSHATQRDDLHMVDFYFHVCFPFQINSEIYVNKLLAIVDAFEKWHHLLKGLQHDMFVYFNHKNLIFHHRSCFELTFSSMGIFITSTPISHHILFRALIRKITHIIPLLIPHVKGGKCNLQSTMWCHLKDGTPQLQALQVALRRIEIKFKIFQVIIISSSFVMVCYIMMGSYMYLMALFNSKLCRPNMRF